MRETAPSACARTVVVVTTIQPPTSEMEAFADVLRLHEMSLLIVGDRKGPSSYPLAGAALLTLHDQLTSEWRLAPLLPENHYARKNLGYLTAIRSGCDCLFETDDDNAPLPGWSPRIEYVDCRLARAAGWLNAYAYFSNQRIWPRGFPLDAIASSACVEPPELEPIKLLRAPVQQGLASGDPDVDALWRITHGQDIQWSDREAVGLAPGAWCPFNSQCTWWWAPAWPLLYLPVHCTFRMTDIWRGLIAQRCLWAAGYSLVFTGPEVVQRRNSHVLARDFESELPGYLGNSRFVDVLGSLDLAAGDAQVAPNLRACYEALVAAGFFPEKELALLEAWTQDLRTARAERS